MRRLILLLPIALAACATAGSSGESNVVVETYSRGQPMPGANCFVSTGSGSWNVVTPATVPIGSASGDLRVVCNKAGYRTSELLFRPSSVSGSSMGVGVGGGSGHVGVGVGMSVPITLGRGGYPTRVSVDMNPQ
jgi:hypothetical protein